MNVASELVHWIAEATSCKVEGFQQTYIGLPLSNVKLNLANFEPLIAKADRYLAGWQSTLLSPGGRLILFNSVLDGLPTYLMAALLLSQGIVQALDRLRRAFLWIGEDYCSAVCSIITWDRVCWSKQEGGLDVKNIALQNQCLLLKLIHKLHSPRQSVLASWVWE